MKYDSKWAAASAFAIYSIVGLPALAQTATSPADPNAAPPPVTMAETNAAPAGAAEAPPEPSPSAFPVTTMAAADEPRPDVVEHSWPNRPMLITGAVVLGGTYGASVIVGALSDREADEKLFLPVVGPWMDLKARDCDVNDCGNDTFNKALLITDGALQGLGALSLVLSLVIPESTKKPWYLIGDDSLSVAPQVGTTTTGLSAFGRF